jgi:hypothetical protein
LQRNKFLLVGIRPVNTAYRIICRSEIVCPLI